MTWRNAFLNILFKLRNNFYVYYFNGSLMLCQLKLHLQLYRMSDVLEKIKSQLSEK